MPPRRELREPAQVKAWVEELGEALSTDQSLILIGSGALLLHAALRNVREPLPENSMDVDPVTQDDELAGLLYDAGIGSDFEKRHGWHVNPMPQFALRDLPEGWQDRTITRAFGHLKVVLPAPADILAPKLKRGEPRDHAHAVWAKRVGLLAPGEPAGNSLPSERRGHQSAPRQDAADDLQH